MDDLLFVKAGTGIGDGIIATGRTLRGAQGTAGDLGPIRADVEADIEQAMAYGISGVPFYVVDRQYGVSGAQDPAVFAQVLSQAAGLMTATS